MKFTSIVALLAAPLAITATHVSWANYDNPSQSLDTVACSNGPNGLETKGYKTLGDIPNFPNVTGAYVASWNSPNCGSCWNVTWSGTGVTVTVTVVDGAGDESFNLSEEAMDFLTKNRAVELGSVEATVVQVDRKLCGFSQVTEWDPINILTGPLDVFIHY